MLAAGREQVARRVQSLGGAAVRAPARRHACPACQARKVWMAATLSALQAAEAVVGARIGIHHCLQSWHPGLSQVSLWHHSITLYSKSGVHAYRLLQTLTHAGIMELSTIAGMR